MKQTIILLFTLICSVFNCTAQIKDIQDSPFINISLSGILVPVFPPSRAELKRRYKELKKLKKELGVPDDYVCVLRTDFPEIIDFDLKVDRLRLPDGRIATFLTAQVENKEILFEEINKIPTSKVKISGRIMPLDPKMRGFFEDDVIFSKDETISNSPISENKQSYTKGLLLPPGFYKLTFALRDSGSGRFGVRSVPLEVPSF